MGDERSDDADQRRADVYSSARIGAAAALTLVLVVLLVLDVAVPDYDISPGILLPAPGRDPRAPRTRGLGVLAGREVTTTTALLTNKAYGYPTRGAPVVAGSRRSSACLHQTANAKATAMQERNHANRTGSWGPSATAYIVVTGTVVRADRSGEVRGLEPGRRRASQHEAPHDRGRGGVGGEHERVGARVDRMLGGPGPSPTPTRSSRPSPASLSPAHKATGLRSTAAPGSCTPTSIA